MGYLPSIRDTIDFIKSRFIYTFGRGIIALPLFFGVIAPESILFTGAAVALTAGLQGLLTYRNQEFGKEKLIHLYRDEIAAKTGVNEAAVNMEHLRAVAYGDKEKGLEPNRVFQEAVERNDKRHSTQYITTAASALLTFGSIMFFSDFFLQQLPKIILEALPDTVRHMQLIGGKTLGAVLVPAGGMLASGWVMSMVNRALDWFADDYLGLSEKTANERIQDIKNDLGRGKTITQEQVFGVFVAADKILDSAIAEHYGNHYFKLDKQEQTDALLKHGLYYPISDITRDINNHQIQVDELAFVAVGQHSGNKRLEEPPREIVERRMQEQQRDVRRKYGRTDDNDSEPSPARPMKSFVERVTGHTTGSTTPTLRNPSGPSPSSHVERLLKQVEQMIDQPVQR